MGVPISQIKLLQKYIDPSLLYDTYNMHSLLKQKDGVSIEAKRVIFNEQIDMIANEIPYIKPKTIAGVSLPSSKSTFMKLLPCTTAKTENINTNDLLKKYFQSWVTIAKMKREHSAQLKKQIEPNEKLDTFLRTLKKNKKQLQSSNSCQDTKSEETRKIIDVKNRAHTEIVEANNFKNRFKAQQDIIEIQKAKLLQQERLIQDLKLGKINEEICKSIENTKLDIRETYSKCSTKIKCKIKPTIDGISTESFNLHLISSQAPKIVQEMELRALERAEKRQINLERKRIMDEHKKRQIEHNIESKRAQDEEERKLNLKAIKERRMKELEIQQQRQLNKQIYLENVAKSVKFHKRKLARLGLNGFIKLVMIQNYNFIRSEHFYETLLIKKGLHRWIEYVSQINAVKNSLVDSLFRKRLLQKMLKQWRNVYILRKQTIQVADDLYEMQLQSKTFIHWHRYTCYQYILQEKNMKKAERHYHSRIVLQYFYQWRSLPAVIILEKAKEEKKRKWREKVWEILPDYCPVLDV